MDTTKSDNMVKNFLQKEPKYLRKEIKNTITLDANPEQIFPLFCPTLEADWLYGWDCELIYTESGYAENMCVFRNKNSFLMGAGLWIFNTYKPNELIEFVKFEQDTLMHVSINFAQNGDGTTLVTQNVTYTALSEKGNEILKNLTSNITDSYFNLIKKMLNYYLEEGKLISKKNLLRKNLKK